jgi:uncharacterized protein (TIGR01777 family)
LILLKFPQEESLKVFITGGTGFVGRSLAHALIAQEHSVTVLSRRIPREGRIPGVSYIGGNPAEEGQWQSDLADFDAIVNLAGSSIFSRWSAGAKHEIRTSRINATKNIVNALPEYQETGKQITLVSGSAIGFYGARSDRGITEETPVGKGFLASVAQEWEEAAMEAAAKGVRVVLCRLGVVLGRNGGAMGKMLTPFKWGVGSPLGSGKQWFSWIHIDDLVNIFLYVLKQQEISGPVNCTAPNPITNMEMSKTLGKTLGRPVFLPAIPSIVAKILLGEFSSVFLEGQHVIPAKLLQDNFVFQYPELSAAFADLVSK